MKTIPYWLDTRPAFTGGAKGAPPARADVVVIGGGFTGLAAALGAARNGASVVLLEADKVAAAASGRNGGQCNAGFGHDYKAAIDIVGRERAREIYLAYNDAVDTVEHLARREGIDCDFQRNGTLKLAHAPETLEKFRRSLALIHADADETPFLVERADMAGEIGSDRFFGALVMPKGAMLHVGKFGVGLAEAASRAGALVFEDSPVTGLTRKGGTRYVVETAAGAKIDAGQVVLATGISRKGPFGWIRRRVVPVGSYIIATEPLGAERARSLIPQLRTMVISRTIGNYFRISPDNRLLFGGRARFSVSSPLSDLKSGEILRAQMHGYFPQLRDARIEYCWGGMIDGTRGKFARAGQHDGLYYAMGYSGSGVQMATHMGTVLSEMLGGDDSRNPYKGMDWPAIPGHFGPPWFLPFLGAWLKMKERLGH